VVQSRESGNIELIEPPHSNDSRLLTALVTGRIIRLITN